MVEIKPADKLNLEKLPKEEIEKLDGQYDDDGFYILEIGGFYDPLGYYFDKNGVDGQGGFYDKYGYYIYPKKTGGELGYLPTFELNEDGRSVDLRVYTKEEIEADQGEYDQDGFYILKVDGSYYDPLGYYFDKEGFDAVGGTYDNDGYYIQPLLHEGLYGEDIEDYTLDDEENEENQLADDDIQRQADMHEHIMPA